MIRLLLGFFSVLLIRYLIVSLKTGFVRWGPKRGKCAAHRSDEPKTFWFLWVLNAASLICFLWVLLR